ncbi:DNA alkylation repair protein [Leptospira jelokensis]|uniref:DNA alkylation repair protein n=1 Tax=Leptospira jelokensis TaxID=2484931 RepID=A0A4Z1A408_9LEPT|nr:DNA alkylation repair protein [Leptospira jelokensis]TGL64937.1 DNA alkylation repair protein [Leptospira jelokensis]
MEPLKNIYSNEWIKNLSEIVSQVDAKITPKTFQLKVLESPWKQFELKERINRIADVFLFFWNEPLPLVEPKLLNMIDLLRSNGIQNFNFPYIFVNDIVTKSGLNDFVTSMRVLEKTTVFSSAEFAIRFYYQSHFDRTLKQMKLWSKHKEAYVRRLASEGGRPLLPWGIGIPEIKRNPEIHLPILENLWDDENEVVRRSVSNHLNDISKINPDLVLEFCKKRFGKSEILDKNLKHALRGLLKKGNHNALTIFSYDTKWKPSQLRFVLKQKVVKIGDSLEFEIQFQQKSKNEEKIRIEYKIGFLLANQSYGYKTFKISEKLIPSNENVKIVKRHSFKTITTRVFYPGIHKITIIFNGREFESLEFKLINKK